MLQMENQGYEEEQSRAEEQSTFESHYSDQQPHDTIDRSDPIVARTLHAESHVYEDISIDTTAASKFSERISFADEIRETENRQSADRARQAWVNESPSIGTTAILDRSVEQNLTLASSAEISANHKSATSSSRPVSGTNENDLKRASKNPRELPGSLPDENILESVSSSPREKDSSRDVPVQPDRRTNRRRRKKDCKHCRSKLAVASSCEKLNELTGSEDTILRENEINHRNKDPDFTSSLLFRDSRVSDSLLRSQNMKIYPIVKRTSLEDIGAKSTPIAFLESELHSASRFLVNDRMLGQVTENNQNKILGESKNWTDMRINSIYSQERWYGKESPIFYTDVKDQNPFQRAYSLPARTHTPTSQNRVNLRRSVRNEPPPHPARLDKHRRGWTLHLARPTKVSGCSSALVPLLIIVLILLGVAGVALYIVFEPEKLQIIQQYLKSSTGKLTEQNVTSGEPIISVIPNDGPDLISTTGTTMTMSVDAFTIAAFLNGDASSFPESVSLSMGVETEAASRNANATRYCDDCLEGEEVCVALVDEEVPICRSPYDREDPTGCAGFCIINKQKCHRLDIDAFRCVEIEHYCLDDEWTCSNTLCIPLNKRCDGHMNCYDHSDEYDCVCNLETHFQCGNETSCLPLERRCDGKIDCWDATDEINCTLACPLDNEFTCSNGECILKTRFCDGLSDCSDGSDEPHGCQGRCNKHEFTCQNGRCITKGMKCNGVDDCGDGTDERHCKDRFT